MTALPSLTEIFHNLLQVLPYREVLGAFLLAFPALLAERGIAGDSVKNTGKERRVDLTGLVLVVLQMPAVEILKALRDADPMGTRSAVPAAGAGDKDPLLQLFFHLPEQ